MKTLKKTFTWLSALSLILIFSPGLLAQPVFDLPTTDFTPTGASGGQVQIPSIPMTLNVGDIETGIVNRITGEPLNDVALVFSPNLPISPGGQGPLPEDIRFYTIYHTSDTDTRALMLSAPADLTYPPDKDHLPFFTSTSVQILDLNRDGQNDLAFNGTSSLSPGPSPWNDGPAPVLGVAGTGSDPFVGGNVDMIGRTKNFYDFPLFIGLATYGGQPSLASGDMDGDGFTDLVINDWMFPNPTGAGGPVNFGQLLSTFLNKGTLGSLLPPIETMILIPPPFADQGLFIPFYIVVDDFDGDGIQDAGVVYAIEITSGPPTYNIRFMAYQGLGNGAFNTMHYISEPLPAIFGDIFEPIGGPVSLTYGDFDGNGHLDFAVSYNAESMGNTPLSTVPITDVITCAPGTPPTCDIQHLEFPTNFEITHLDAGDFDGDGLDDLVQAELACDDLQCTNGNSNGRVSAYLNQGGSFSTTPDQIISPASAPGNASIVYQVIARDIDGCSPEDIAFIGNEIPDFAANGAPTFVNFSVVAFASQGEIIADAGEGIPTDSGIQIGGNPTCFDPNGNPFNVQWTQISGETAIISDPTVANPIITDLSTESTFQVTCQTACGEATDTVTVNMVICITGSGNPWDTIRDGCAGCSLNRSASGEGTIDLGLLVLGLLIGMSLLGVKRKKTRI